MDSLDFLSDDPSAKGMSRKTWAKKWMIMNLSDGRIKQWMPVQGEDGITITLHQEEGNGKDSRIESEDHSA